MYGIIKDIKIKYCLAFMCANYLKRILFISLIYFSKNEIILFCSIYFMKYVNIEIENFIYHHIAQAFILINEEYNL